MVSSSMLRKSLAGVPFAFRAPACLRSNSSGLHSFITTTVTRQVSYDSTCELHLELCEKFDQQTKKIQNLVKVLKGHTPPLYGFTADRVAETTAKLDEIAENLRSMLITSLEALLASGKEAFKEKHVYTAMGYFEMVIEQGSEIQSEDEKVKLWMSEACYHKAICLITVGSEDQNLANDVSYSLKITNLLKESLQFNPGNELARSLLKVVETPGALGSYWSQY